MTGRAQAVAELDIDSLLYILFYRRPAFYLVLYFLAGRTDCYKTTQCDRFAFESLTLSVQSGFQMIGTNPTLESLLEDLYQCDQSSQGVGLFVHFQWNP